MMMIKVSRVGIHIDRCDYLALSPDGIVMDPNGQSIRLVEIKCPYSAQDMTVEQACCELKSFCCHLDKDKKPCSVLCSLKPFIKSTLLLISMTILLTSALCIPIINLCVLYINIARHVIFNS